MKFTLEKAAGVRIHAHEADSVTLVLPEGLEFPEGGEPVTDEPGLCRVSRNLVISSGAIQHDEAPASYEALEAQHLEFALTFNPEIILLGTGNTLRFPSPPLMSLPARHGVGFEVMDTAAACRTFNILAGENRPVVAILLLGE
ncbi:MAG: MTH938/NDUFAF3 family protein [Thioalkalispiraceae bacterium]|jgi:uncharacterized protein